MALVRNLAFTLIFYPGTVIAVLLGFPAALIGNRALTGVVIWWARWHRWCARWLLGIRSRIEGDIPSGPVLVAAKHQSNFETVEMLLYVHEPAVVLKRELADIPGWGWVAKRYGVIPVDRDGGAAALRRMLKAGQAAVAAGRPLAIFPEGTRIPPGQQPPLQAGFAGLYRAFGIPVVPIALDSGRLWPRGSIIKKAGIVTVRFGAPIPPGLPRKEIEARVHAAINALETPL
jgi:1-acyl-sn-glycerol-3-phosphate acyltransferase